ncbi:MAG: SWIB/MDM2 domain-containing protein, partial [Rhodoferax sp.]
PTPSCDFKSGQVILQQPVERAQMHKLLSTGKTDLLDKFVSMRTRRGFKAMLAWDAAAGKVNFEFAPSKFPPRKSAAAPAAKASVGKATSPVAKAAVGAKTAVAKTTKAKSSAAKSAAKTPARDPAKSASKAPRKVSAASGKVPSAALAAVIGGEPITRPQVMKKLWDYIKANGLQDAKDKRAINADAKLLLVFGKAQVSMFELAGIAGRHLG